MTAVKETPAMSLPQSRPRKQLAADVIKTASIPGKTPTVEEAAKELGEELVRVVVPKAYKLTDDSHRIFDYGPHTREMPPTHANHWYSKANGVSLAKTKE